MKLFTSTAIALAAGMSAAPVAAQYGSSAPAQQPRVPTTDQREAQPSQPGTVKISKEATKAVLELQKAVNANDLASVPAKLAAAQAVAKTNEDRYFIAQLQLRAALTAKDDSASAAAIDAIAASQYLDASKVSDLYSAVGVNFYNAKNFDAAAAAFEKSATLSPQSAKPLTMLAETRNAQGRAAEGAASMQRALQLGTAGGQKPSEDLYKRALAMAYGAKSTSAIELGRQWVAAYPSADSWRNSIAVYRNMTKPGVEETLDLLRLMNAAGALTAPSDYELYATAAANQGNFVEAQAVIDQGLAAKQIDPSSAQFRDVIAGLKAKPKATAADLEVAAKTAPAGSTLIGIGDRYYGLGQYADAAATYRKALSKPGTDPNVANLHIGMALARSGDKAGAAAALKTVTGPLAEVAKYWLLYVQSPA